MISKYTLQGPSATFDNAFNLEFVELLRNEAMRTKALAEGAMAAWKKAVDTYAKDAARRLGYTRGFTYSIKVSDETKELHRLSSDQFIFSHAEGNEFGVPGLYFFPTKLDGSKRKSGVIRLMLLTGERL